MNAHAIAKTWFAERCAARVYLIRKAKYTQYEATAVSEKSGVHLLMRRFHNGR
jgi:hypothetical protein